MSMVKCEGCGKAHEDDPHVSASYRTMQVADEEVIVCGGGMKNIYGIKRDCAIKALSKRSLCPGCGRDVHDWPIEVLCDSCKHDLDLATKVKRQRENVPIRVKLPAYYEVARSAGSHADRDAEEAIRAFLAALAPVLSPRVRESGSGSDVFVEVTEKQRDALAALSDAIGAFWRAGHAAGYAEGRNLLLGLATGKVSPEQFSEREVERARRQQED